MALFKSRVVIALACLIASYSVVNAELETVKLSHPSGSNAEVFLFGAHVKSFHAADDPSRDVIFLSNHSYLDGVNPIMGGIPIVFPNFGSAKGFPGHGFARVTNWTLAGVAEASDAAGATVATFTMAASDSTRKMWPVEFELEYEVKLLANTLETALRVHNTFTSAIDFHALLHNYVWVDDIRNQGVNVTGLVGLEYYDKVAKENKTESREILTFDAETDSVYNNAPSTLTVSIRGANNARGRLVTVEKSAFIGNGAHQTAQPSDAVIWNPWVERSKQFKDFGADEYINMLAVEPGRVSEKQSLPAGQTYTLHQSIAVKLV
ncbi:Cellular repressor of E1A-stimulated proteins 1 [Phytophthora boehmeriae]|uniref:glucose-6-phosphate 1-epimerase n=1 Tax=Phytophthora boehmeriae TaxID=109152 RepID=A0A8T1WJQ2_9STRA|nr:Cellular repressor of E1A-stimulated proteins 1 [Phytophthora boehmeriae]